MNNPLVSIIVPCYNQAQYLSETLDSVLAQTYPYWECIIVDDGSPDNTEEFASIYCKKDARFKYLYKENGGLSSARNAGIKASLGEFILPLDSDDLIGSGYLENAVERFQSYPETKLVYCKAELFGEITGEWKLPDYKYEDLLFENMLFCSAIYRRSDYDLTKGYNEDLVRGYEDWNFWINFLNESDIVYRISEVYFFYRYKSQSMLRELTRDDLEQQLRIMIYNLNQPKYQKFIPDLIWRNPLIKQQKKDLLAKDQEIKRLLNTKAYRLGKFLLKPQLFFFMRKIFNK